MAIKEELMLIPIKTKDEQECGRQLLIWMIGGLKLLKVRDLGISNGGAIFYTMSTNPGLVMYNYNWIGFNNVEQRMIEIKKIKMIPINKLDE